MGTIMAIVTPVIWFAVLGVALGVMLAFASKLFAVEIDERVPKIAECLPGANCGGCGYAGCTALAEAVVSGEASPSSCTVGGAETASAVAEVMGVEPGEVVRMRAQVMCSGTSERAKKKYIYEGAHDCIAAVKLGGGDKLCPNGCIGLGTCVSSCTFGAISVVEGVAAVEYEKCQGCGKCVSACPKSIIKLIPYESVYWVGCMSVDEGKITRKYCDAGCISCHICEKNCPARAITVNDCVASIDYTRCTGCGICVEKCPRKIIKSA